MSAKKKVVVAMSGGVDSSVAAALLQREGYDCVGVFMRLGNDPADLTDEQVELIACSPELRAEHEKEMALSKNYSAQKTHKQGCCSTSDAADARFVAGMLEIPFYALNFQHDFGGIIDYFVREYNAGRTPNPCVRCNEYLKFGKLSKYARAIGADYVATGHYARVVHGEDGSQLLRGRDAKKDQSYVLFGVPRDELSRMLLPIGDLEKTEVRRVAEELGLPVFNKPDSQEICFVPDHDYARLVKVRSPGAVRAGEFVDAAGKVVGKHEGHQHFTIGQRKGVGVAFGYPIYVTGIDPATNRVTLAEKEALLHRTLVAREVNWLTGPEMPRGPQEAVRCLAKVRYNSPPAPAVARMTGADELTVTFDEAVAAITPGQAVVCYDGERLVGGGWIESIRD
ncbi:MAG TPA: tRNA 2-thiouridine(34) synthase MnmA [Phycisphaerae bacterium]|nr:tRNA 2-thiouridine(34) synthase MnmA [Phycisphaerae bacterium]